MKSIAQKKREARLARHRRVRKKLAALQNDQDSAFSSQHVTSMCRRLTTWVKIR